MIVKKNVSGAACQLENVDGVHCQQSFVMKLNCVSIRQMAPVSDQASSSSLDAGPGLGVVDHVAPSLFALVWMMCSLAVGSSRFFQASQITGSWSSASFLAIKFAGYSQVSSSDFLTT